MNKKIFLTILFISFCISVAACNRTQSVKDAYRETEEQMYNETIEREDVEEEVPWDTLSNDYLYEDEVMVCSDLNTIADIKVKVLDAFYSDSYKDGGEYFESGDEMKGLDQMWPEIEDKKYLFIKVEIENMTGENVQYCVAKIHPYACKIGKNNTEISPLNVSGSDQAFDSSEDEGGNYYYILFLQPGEKRIFTTGYIVRGNILAENIDSIYIKPGNGRANYDVENRESFINGDFKLLHVPVRKFEAETDIYQEETDN